MSSFRIPCSVGPKMGWEVPQEQQAESAALVELGSTV